VESNPTLVVGPVCIALTFGISGAPIRHCGWRRLVTEPTAERLDWEISGLARPGGLIMITEARFRRNGVGFCAGSPRSHFHLPRAEVDE